jgi:hypothetical protein
MVKYIDVYMQSLYTLTDVGVIGEDIISVQSLKVK